MPLKPTKRAKGLAAALFNIVVKDRNAINGAPPSNKPTFAATLFISSSVQTLLHLSSPINIFLAPLP